MENLLSNSESIIDDIVDNIKNQEDYIKYISIREKVSKNNKIIQLIDDIKKLQKEIVKLKCEKKDYLYIDDLYNKKLDELNNIPLYIELMIYQNKINNNIQYVKDFIQYSLDEITK